MAENEIKEAVNHEEHTIVTPHDFLMPHHVAEDYEHMCFYCPKCDSSVIYMPEEYAKNNLMNSMKEEINEQPPGDRINGGWMKIVLKCDNCKWCDIIMKFMKERERIDYGDVIRPAVNFPKKYYSTVSNIPCSSITQPTTSNSNYTMGVQPITTARKYYNRYNQKNRMVRKQTGLIQ